MQLFGTWNIFVQMITWSHMVVRSWMDPSPSPVPMLKCGWNSYHTGTPGPLCDTDKSSHESGVSYVLRICTGSRKGSSVSSSRRRTGVLLWGLTREGFPASRLGVPEAWVNEETGLPDTLWKTSLSEEEMTAQTQAQESVCKGKLAQCLRLYNC